MAEISLSNGEVHAKVNTDGAWLEQLATHSGDILFPKQFFTVGDVEKPRGGCHVCLPNFGPGGDSGQPQHGYGRNVEWAVGDQTDSSVTLQLSQGVDRFAPLSSRLHYDLGANVLHVALEVTNTGQEPLPVSPGFHPYFATASSQEPLLDEEHIDLDQLSEATFMDGATHSLTVGRINLQLQSETMPVWALWSDRLGEYVCLEPTAAGNAFEENAAQVLQPDDTARYAFEISWEN